MSEERLTRTWVQKPRSLGWATLVPFALAVCWHPVGGPEIVKTFACAALCALVIASVRGRKLATIARDRDALRIDGELWALGAEIDGVHVVALPSDPESDEPTPFAVRIRTWSATRSFFFEREADALKFAADVRAIPAGSARGDFVADDARALRWGAMALMGAALALLIHGSAWGAAASALSAVIVFAVSSTPVAARATGSWLLVQRFGRVRRFGSREIAHFSITRDSTPARAVLTLRLRDGRRLALREESHRGGSEAEGIQAIMRELGAGGAPSVAELPPEIALVRRRGRTTRAWLEELREFSTVEPAYRSAAPRQETLWDILEDPAAPDDARIGAAVLLRGAPEARRRIAALAEASRAGDDKVRVALETLAEEQADVELALGSVREE